MADDAGKQEPPSLDEFSKRLDAAKGDVKDAAATKEREANGQAMGRAFRVASELLAALIVGPALGLGLDMLANTSPWGLLAGIFLGFAAGVMNVARAMKELDAGKDAGGE